MFADLLQEKFSEDTFTVNRGRKYDKIVHNHSVYAFVNVETGELIKAAGWNAPALNKDKETAGKYFLDTAEGVHIAILNADRFAGFLYSDFKVRIPA